MATQIIPFQPSTGNYRFSTTLEGTEYVFTVLWNDRDNSYYFDVYEQDQTPIVSGVRAVLGVFLGRRSWHPLFVQGVMVAVDTSKKGLDAGYDDLGSRVQILYIPVLDLIQNYAKALGPS